GKFTTTANSVSNRPRGCLWPHFTRVVAVDEGGPSCSPLTTTDGAAERQAILRETERLQALVMALQAGTPVGFRAIHAVAQRLTQAAYRGWTKAVLAQITPRTPPPLRPRPRSVAGGRLWCGCMGSR